MSVKNLYNFASVVSHRPLEIIDDELVRAVAKPVKADASVLLLQIEKALAEAQAAQHKRQYELAIARYRRARGLIVRILFPSLPDIRYSDLAVVPAKTHFEPLLGASLALIDTMPVEQSAPVGPAFAAGVPFPEELRLVTERGVRIVDDVPRDVRGSAELGESYASRGEWQRAEFFYRQAKAGLDAAEANSTAGAALDVSLGGVLVQLGRAREAQPLLDRASTVFREAHDTIGEAQANINLGAAAAQNGDDAAAERFDAQAEQLLRRAQELPAKSSTARQHVRSVLTELFSREGTAPGQASEAVISSATANTAGTRSTRPADLAISHAEGRAITLRQPGKDGGWASIPLLTRAEAARQSVEKQLTMPVGDQTFRLQWRAGGAIETQPIKTGWYDARRTFLRLSDVVASWNSQPEMAVHLPHLYYYVIPIGIGDCQLALGRYEAAASSYIEAAGYEFVNPTLEAPHLWRKLAQAYLSWGDRIYRDDDLDGAAAVFHKILLTPGGENVVDAASPLYALPGLRAFGARVSAMLTALPPNGVPDFDGAVASIVLTARARLIQIAARLDYLGMPADYVPIWSFDFLQNVARYFTEQAIQAEREFVNWWDRAENEELTRQQLESATEQARGELELARRQETAALLEAETYSAAAVLATTRRANAQANRAAYDAFSWERMHLASNTAWYSAQNPWELDHPVPGDGRHIHEIIAANTLQMERATRTYELGAMARQVAELAQAQAVAAVQTAAAQARLNATRQMTAVAALRTNAAAEALGAFDSQFFTPETWFEMGAFMRAISDSYFYMALRIARLMQRAYNFENDTSLAFIRTDYSTNTVKGLLGGDALLRDIDSFTFDLITTATRKTQPVKHTISLAERFPYLLETALRATGSMQFETRVEDFDEAHPGTYGQRIQRVEVEVEGVLPSGGVHGTLSCDGISRYRTAAADTVKVRVHSREALQLSEFRVREDSLIFPADSRKLGLFEGAGVASTWTLELPRGTNDLDYRMLTDVRITFYYTAKYDDGLAAEVRERLSAIAGITARSRTFPLRFAFPDAFFHFQDTGELAFTLTPFEFRQNETNVLIDDIALLVVPEPGMSAEGLVVRLSTPAHPDAIAATANASGAIVSAPGHPWAAIAGSGIGDYRIEIRAADNPGVAAGTLRLERLENLVLLLSYTFTPRS